MSDLSPAAQNQIIIDENKAYTLFSWSAQASLNPIVAVRGEGSHFWDAAGKRYIDFSSQLMNVNIGHGDKRVIQAIKDQADKLTYMYPGIATPTRGELGKLLHDITPGSLCKSFFTLGGADAVESAMKMARLYTGKQKVITRYRSYHGATFGAATAGGDPRRLANEPGVPWIVRVHDAYSYRSPIYRHVTPEQGDLILADLMEETILLEGPENVAAIMMEGYSGSSGILQPKTLAYWQRIRQLCDDHNIVLIIDEVMSGFGRTGKWFGIDHYNIEPDIMVIAKGLTSGYIPLGAAVVNPAIARYFDKNPLVAGLTYSGHAMGCAAAIATIKVYQEDKLIARAHEMGTYLDDQLQQLSAKHPSIGEYRGTGLFYVIEVVKNKNSKAPMSQWNKPYSEPMAKLAQSLRDSGMHTFVRWNWIFIAPPLCITKPEVDEGLAMISRALEFTDAATN